jgi:hypothetical protein
MGHSNQIFSNRIEEGGDFINLYKYILGWYSDMCCFDFFDIVSTFSCLGYLDWI